MSVASGEASRVAGVVIYPMARPKVGTKKLLEILKRVSSRPPATASLKPVSSAPEKKTAMPPMKAMAEHNRKARMGGGTGPAKKRNEDDMSGGAKKYPEGVPSPTIRSAQWSRPIVTARQTPARTASMCFGEICIMSDGAGFSASLASSCFVYSVENFARSGSIGVAFLGGEPTPHTHAFGEEAI